MSLRAFLVASLLAAILAATGIASVSAQTQQYQYKAPATTLDPSVRLKRTLPAPSGTSDGPATSDSTTTQPGSTDKPPTGDASPPPSSTAEPTPPRRCPPPLPYPPPAPVYVIVPDVITLELGEGEARLAQRRLRMAVDAAPAEGEISEIASQAPGAGTRVPAGSTVRVSAKAAEVLTKVPDLMGKKPEEASTLARQAILSLVSSKAEPSSPDDTVEEQQPAAGTAVPAGSKVFVVWTVPTAVVPKLVSLSTAAARTALEKASLTIGVSGEPGAEGRIDKIEHQYPIAGTRVPKGTRVKVSLALAPPAPVKPPVAQPPAAPVAQPPAPAAQPPAPVARPPAAPAPPPTRPPEIARTPEPWLSMGMLFAILSVVGAAGAWFALRFAKHKLSHEHRLQAHGGIRITARRDIGVQESDPPKLAQPLIGVRVNWMTETSMRTI